jgi:hypothetical protein
MTLDMLRITCLLVGLLAAAVPGAAQTADADPCGSPAGGFNTWVGYRV